MSFMGFIGALFVFSGAFHLWTYLQRRRWPIVEGTLDSIDLKIEPPYPSEVVGLDFQPNFTHKIRYSYRGHPYIIELSEKEPIAETLKLRVNPEKPYVAYLDNKTLIFPALAVIIGIILILVSIKIGVDGTE